MGHPNIFCFLFSQDSCYVSKGLSSHICSGFEIDNLAGGGMPVTFSAGRKSLLKGVKNFPQGRICLLDWQQKESFICIDCF